MVWICDKFSWKASGAAVSAAGVFQFLINFSQQCPVVLSNAFPKTCYTISSSFDPAISDNRKLIPNSLVLRCCIPQLAVVTGRQDADFLASFADGSLHSWDGGEQEKVEDKESGQGADYSDGPWTPGPAPTPPPQLTFMHTAPPKPDPVYYYKPEPKFIYHATPEPEPKYYHNPQPRPPPTWAPERKVIYHAKPEHNPKYCYNPK